MDSDISSTTGYDCSNTSGATGTSGAGTGRKKKPRKLTIEQPTKIDVELSKKRLYKHRPSTGVRAIKWISTFILAALLLAFVTQSKVSVISLSEHMHQTSQDPTSTAAACRMFVMLFLIVLIPNCLNFFRGIWEGLFRKDIPWPKKTALLVGFFVSMLESGGTCIFVMKIPAMTQPYIVILLMSCVFLVPIGVSLFKALFISERQSTKKRIFFLIAFLFELIGIFLTGFLWTKKNSTDLKDIWYPFAGVLCLSVAWLPELQSLMLQTKAAHVKEKVIRNVAQSYSYTGSDETSPKTISDGTIPPTISEERELELSHMSIEVPSISEGGEEEPKIIAPEKPTWKMVIYLSGLKIIFTFMFSFLLLRFSIFGTNATEVIQHFKMGWYDWDENGIYYFVANCCSSVSGYVIGFIACTTCMQRGSYVLPLFLATPLAAVLFSVKNSCVGILIDAESNSKCDLSDTLNVVLFCGAVACLVIAYSFSFGYLIISSQSLVRQNEVQLFWLPTYNPVLLEQWLLLSKRNEHNDEFQEDPIARAKRSRVIICTTMYREADYEMKQLLESINGVNMAQREGHRHFESHIFFDGAVKDRNPTDFVLKLVSLIPSTLGLKPEECSKMITPYGMSLSWKLEGQHGMVFRIHLKDNYKVKNKKRWSQIMYMSYVLDYLMLQEENVTDDETYVLTTDADVRFTPDAVEALLDLMTRDPSVGAVCARTHPLGTGPMVWYQVFEYAIGHWFQKAAEHVIGSVLCSPGCFSVYRCKALRDIVSQYATNVEHAFDFLTKDMGEDRWLCTLMVQTGWRIEYCAASENSTHCPEDFDEFYKQRRRWVASTLANMFLLLKEWNIVAKFNHRVSVFFLMYQAVLLFATLIGPSSVILVVSGGLVYGWGIDTITSLVLQILLCAGYTIICLFTSSKTQLAAAKFLTFLYAVVMTAVVVGTAVQVATDFSEGEPVPPAEPNGTASTTTINPNLISSNIQVSTTTVYLGCMVGIFATTGLLHLKECIYLAHGIWYLLCLPSGYLILMLYSICNITDRSWGTREAESDSLVSSNLSWQKTVQNFYRTVCFCCFPQAAPTSTISTQTEIMYTRQRTHKLSESGESDQTGRARKLSTDQDYQSLCHEDFNRSTDARNKSVVQDLLVTVHESEQTPSAVGVTDLTDEEDGDIDVDGQTVIDVKDWLPFDLRETYTPIFKDNGYDNTMLIAGMTEKELKDIGVKTKGTKQKLLQQIQLLPSYEIVAEVPENVRTWLESIGLLQYKANFDREQIRSSKEMEVLKSFGRNEIEKELKITKKGHVKRLLYAIRRLRNPTADERKIIETRKAIDATTTHNLKRVNIEEYDFWEQLKNKCLLPSSTAFGLEEDLKKKLGDLRNQWLMVFAISNTLWLILISTLANQGKLLNVFGSNLVGFVVLILFTFVLLIQFLAMIVHRVGTLTHFLGRAPYKGNEAYNTSWAFDDRDMRLSASMAADDRDAHLAVKQARNKAQQRLRKPVKKRNPEKQPLLSNHTPNHGDSMV